MTKLMFPTEAEQVLAAAKNGQIRSIAAEAKRRKAERRKPVAGWTEYTFDDDSSLMVRGRGKSYKVEALLP